MRARDSRRPFAALVAAAVGALGLTAIVMSPTASAAAAVDGVYQVTGVGIDNQIVAGPDGNMWVTLDSATQDIAKITPGGTVTEYNPAQIDKPVGITAGPDGNMWVTQPGGVARFSPADPDSAEKFAIADIADPRGITAGPGSNVWTASGDKVIRIPTGVAIPLPEVIPNTGVVAARGIAAGADGNLWVADFGGNQVVRVTPAGDGTKFATGGGPQAIAAHPSQQLVVFADPGTDPQTIGRIRAGGAPQLTNVPMTDPFGVAFGPDGAFWVAQFLTDELGRLTADGQYSTLAGLPAGSGPRKIAAGPAGQQTLWVTLEKADKVARITGVQAPAPPPVQVPDPSSPAPATPGPSSPSAPARPSAPPTGDPSATAVKVRAKAVQQRSRVRVRIRPDLGSEKQWVFRMQRKPAVKGAGPKWRTLAGRYRTEGKRHIATVDLDRGRYRARALPRFGYRGATSAPVRLRR